MQATTIAISIICFILSMCVLYYVIHNAVCNALKNDHYNKVRTRFMIKKLEKEGYSKQAILNIMDAKDDDFWKTVKA